MTQMRRDVRKRVMLARMTNTWRTTRIPLLVGLVTIVTAGIRLIVSGDAIPQTVKNDALVMLLCGGFTVAVFLPISGASFMCSMLLDRIEALEKATGIAEQEAKGQDS